MDGQSTRKWVGDRPLAQPAEDLEDQGLGFDIGTVFERRKILSAMGLGALSLGLAACTPQASPSNGTSSNAASDALTEIPDETAGPYPGDGSNGPDVLEESGIVRRDITSSFGDAHGTAAGVPMTLELNILDLANSGAGFASVAVYVWHCDAQGRYSMYTQGVEDENFLRGVQLADADGKVSFTSIVPACYTGRWPHIHFEIYPDRDSIDDASNAIATSQVALPKNMCDAVYATDGYESSVANLARLSLDTDNVFGDDSGARQLATVTGDVTNGYSVALTVPVDTRTTPSGGAGPAGHGPGTAPPAGPRPSEAPAAP
ncbi:intradiol ring-cleavage dioxygenase [Glutamicibacter sp. X7]